MKNNIIQDLIDLIIYPKYLFECVEEETQIIRPYIINFIFMGVILIISRFDDIGMIGGNKIKLTLVLIFIGILIWIPIILLSFILFIGSKIMRSETSFSKVISVTLYSFIPLYINRLIVSIGEKITNNEYFSISASVFFKIEDFLSSNISLAIYFVLEFVNPFVFWFIALLTIGFSVINYRSKKSTLLMVISTLLIYGIFIFSLIIAFITKFSSFYN